MSKTGTNTLIRTITGRKRLDDKKRELCKSGSRGECNRFTDIYNIAPTDAACMNFVTISPMMQPHSVIPQSSTIKKDLILKMHLAEIQENTANHCCDDCTCETMQIVKLNNTFYGTKS